MKLMLACRRVHLFPGHRPLPHPKLVLHHCCLYRPRISSHIHGPLWLLAPSYPRTSFTSRCSLVHRQIYRGEQILQEMRSSQAGPCSSLLDMQEMCPENGPPLSLAGYMCWIEKLQGVSSVPDIHVDLLLAVLWRHVDLALE